MIAAYAAQGPVYGANCDWTTSDPSVTVTDHTPDHFDSAPTTTTEFTLAKRGAFTATCTIGSASATVPLER